MIRAHFFHICYYGVVGYFSAVNNNVPKFDIIFWSVCEYFGVQYI